MKHSTEQILSILDRCCDAYTFPMLDNGYVYLAAARLSLFRSPEDWAIVIEVFGFSPRSELPDTHIHTFASTLVNRKSPEQYVSQQAYAAYLANNPHNESQFVHPIEPGAWIDQDDPEFVADGAEGVIMRGRLAQRPGPETYRRAGVELGFPPRVRVFELCRVLAHEAREEVLATPDERRVNVPPQLQPLLTLDEWAHPDVAYDARPSGSVTFQQMARVLVSGDLGDYRPAEAPNTHWRNWPEGGTL
jgi:hypothetical protein